MVFSFVVNLTRKDITDDQYFFISFPHIYTLPNCEFVLKYKYLIHRIFCKCYKEAFCPSFFVLPKCCTIQ